MIGENCRVRELSSTGFVCFILNILLLAFC